MGSIDLTSLWRKLKVTSQSCLHDRCRRGARCSLEAKLCSTPMAGELRWFVAPVCRSVFVRGHVHLGKALVPEVMYQQGRKPHVMRLAATHEVQGSWAMRYFIIPSFWASENYCTWAEIGCSFKQNTGLAYHSLWSQTQVTALPCQKPCKQNRKTLSCPTALQSKDSDVVKLT